MHVLSKRFVQARREDKSNMLGYLRALLKMIPRPMRDRLIYSAASVSGFKRYKKQQPAEPIIIVGMLNAASGLGAAARAYYNVLDAGGFEVYGIDLTYLTAAPPSKPNFTYRDGRIVGPGTLVLHLSGTLVPLALFLLGRRVLEGKCIIGHWFWELPQAPPEWKQASHYVDEIWTNTNFSADAVRGVAADKPISVVPYPLGAVRPVETTIPSEQKFNVLVIFNVASNFERKNPCAAIKAFKGAFGNDRNAKLTLKVTNPSEWPQGMTLLREAIGSSTNIELISETLSEIEMERLYGRTDVVLSLHRSEGLGLVVAEAMQRGKPVVATDWSGNTDFFDETVGLPIPYVLVPVSDPQGYYCFPGQVWAEPSVNSAAEALRQLRSAPLVRQRLGDNGRRKAATHFDPSHFLSFMRDYVGRSSS